MSPELKRQSLELLAEIKAGRQAGIFDEATYQKMVVCIAYEFIVGDEVEEGTQMLLMVPVSYYRDIQPKQMVEDKNYAELVKILARKLVFHGKVDNESFVLMQGKAQA